MSEDPTTAYPRLTLGEIAAPEEGSFVDGPFGSNLKSHEYTGSGVRLIQLQNIGDGLWNDENRKFISEAKFRSLARHGAVAGDIAIAKMAEPVARACIIPEVADQFLVVADCIRLRVDTRCYDPAYIAYAINSYETRLEAERKAIGTTRLRINLGTLKTVRCGVPSKPEQVAVVSALEELNRAILSTEKLILKLRSACNGLLNDLLTRGVSDHGEVRPRIDEEPELYSATEFGCVPRSWESTPFGELGSRPQLGVVSRGASRDFRDVNLIKMGNLQANNAIDLRSVERLALSRVGDVEAYRLHDGDILFNTRNTPELVGKTCTWRSAAGCYIFDNNILRMRAARLRVNGHFIGYYLGSSVGRRRLLRLATGTTSVAAIYWKDLRHFKVPLPPPDEQNRIVTMLREMDHSVQREQSLLEKLKLLKAALADDLLTGRVRVTPLLAAAAPELEGAN